MAEVLDVPLRLLALVAVHLHGALASQSPLGAVHDGGGHL
jgi:hypothetical protein